MADRAFALALLKPGYEPYYEGTPDIYPIGCAGHIDDVVPLPDGRFLLTLTGTRRVEFGTMTSRTPYRRHEVRYLDEREPEAGSPEAQGTFLRLLSAHQQIVSALSGRSASLGTDSSTRPSTGRLALDIEPTPSTPSPGRRRRARAGRSPHCGALPDTLGGDEGIVNERGRRAHRQTAGLRVDIAWHR